MHLVRWLNMQYPLVRLLDYKYLIGVAMLLKIGMVRLEDRVEIEKNIS